MSGESKGRMATPRLAATLVLLRDRNASRANDDPPSAAAGRPSEGDSPAASAIEVLMLLRHGKHRFAPRAHVFPGGALEAEDAAAEALSPRWSPKQAAANMDHLQSPEQGLGFYIAALRETFEEAGLLLARDTQGHLVCEGPAPVQAQIRRARTQLLENRLDLTSWLAQQNWTWATESIHYFAHWVTPESRPIRFDTRFFVGRAPRVLQHITADQREVLHAEWVSPAALLKAEKQGTVNLVGATRATLERLSRLPNTDAALQALCGKPVTRVVPKLRRGNDGNLEPVFPWHPDYEHL